jgi:hypothetical protein
MSALRGPAARAADREPATPAQLKRLADTMTAAGVTILDPQWPSTVARIAGPNADPNPATWSRSVTSAVITALDNYLHRNPATRPQPTGTPRPCDTCRGVGWGHDGSGDPVSCGVCNGTGTVTQ